MISPLMGYGLTSPDADTGRTIQEIANHLTGRKISATDEVEEMRDCVDLSRNFIAQNNEFLPSALSSQSKMDPRELDMLSRSELKHPRRNLESLEEQQTSKNAPGPNKFIRASSVSKILRVQGQPPIKKQSS